MIRPGGDVASLRRETGRHVACQENRVHGNICFTGFWPKYIVRLRNEYSTSDYTVQSVYSLTC